MTINFAILGAGRIGQVHARAVAGNENAVLRGDSMKSQTASQAVGQIQTNIWVIIYFKICFENCDLIFH